ncbi:MAG: SMP-30/gluconolactonase/LRE family protein [Propionibacteriaceae bacterium]|jgi:sugar lactone lactonase YvrE|nr:SMP-30/gluconolactonase/LRE family protein [Propionibacteriaceae bacterium]
MTREFQAQPLLPIRANLGEGAVWDYVRQRLLFLDICGGEVFSYNPADGGYSEFRLGRHVADVHPTVSGALLLAPQEGVGLYRGGEYRSLAAPLATTPHLRTNDGNVDPRGRYFIGTMAYDEKPGVAVLYRLDAGNGVTPVLEDLSISNGIEWSPDGTVLYFIDSPTKQVRAFDYDLDSGELGESHIVAQVLFEGGAPDGMTVDAEGGIWVACFGGGQVRRYLPDGVLDAVVHTPGAKMVTSCCFGGSELDTLYITTGQFLMPPNEVGYQPNSGRLFQVKPGVTGKPATLFDDSKM